jgi:hypothetical protein
MIIEGRVKGRDDMHGEILLDVINLISIPREKVMNVMSKRLVTIDKEMNITEAAALIYREFIRAVPVVDNGNVVGMLTSYDVARCMSEGIMKCRVYEATTRRPVIINPADDILEAMERMRRSSIGRLVVVDDQGKPVGMITRTDILTRILKPFEMVEARKKDRES